MKLFKTAKKFGFAAMAILLAASLAFTGCSDGNDGNDDVKDETPIDKPADNNTPTDNPAEGKDPNTETKKTYKAYTITVKEAGKSGEVGYLLQVDNDGSKDANGLKVSVSGLKIAYKIGDGEWIEKDLGNVNLVPDEYSAPKYSKTSVRKVVPGLAFEANSTIQVKVIDATVNPAEKENDIIFAIQREGGDYQFFGASDSENWQPAFAEAEAANNNEGNQTDDDANNEDNTGDSDDDDSEDTTGGDTSDDEDNTGDNTTGDDTTGDNTTGDDEEEPLATKPTIPASETDISLEDVMRITWGDFYIVPAASFEGSTPKTITIYYDTVSAATITNNDDKYVSMKIAANYANAALGAGIASGATLKADDKGALEGLAGLDQSGKSLTYTPTEEEWALITNSSNGLYINGFNVIITAVTLKDAPAAVGDDDTAGDDVTGDDADSDATDDESDIDYSPIGLSGFDGWGFYTVEDKTESGVTISYSGKSPTQYSTCCGADITAGTNNMAIITVKNNENTSAFVKLDIKKDNGSSAVIAALINDTEADVQYGGASTVIPANGEALFEFILNPNVEADKFIVGLNNNDETNATSGSITISDAFMATVEIKAE